MSRHASARDSRRARTASVLLWIVQATLAALFLFAGGMKLVLPAAALAARSPLPIGFVRAIGVLEALGGLGLVVPGLLRLRAELTVAAAAGLVLIMCGAVGATLSAPAFAGKPATALFPVAVGALAAVVAFGRARTTLAAA
jgi:hypothetical protein